VQTHDRSQSLVSEHGVLARLILPGDFTTDDPFDELRGLAQTAGIEVVGTVYQKREHPDQSTYLGKGKVDELAHLLSATDADVVVFDNDLTPAQTRNLEKALDVKVIDRSELDPPVSANHGSGNARARGKAVGGRPATGGKTHP
jgi:GTP-binding protein HflX